LYLWVFVLAMGGVSEKEIFFLLMEQFDGKFFFWFSKLALRLMKMVKLFVIEKIFRGVNCKISLQMGLEKSAEKDMA